MSVKLKVESAFVQLLEAGAIATPPPTPLNFLESRQVPKIVLPCVIAFVSTTDDDVPVQSGNSNHQMELILRTRTDVVSELHDQLYEWLRDLVYVEVAELAVSLSDLVSDFTVVNIVFGQTQHEFEEHEFITRINFIINIAEVD
jgi:hypothetical protein